MQQPLTGQPPHCARRRALKLPRIQRWQKARSCPKEPSWTVPKCPKKSEPSKTPKSKSKKPSSIATSSDRATAIEVLLRAATAAKAARRAAGEDSEEEAPLPELPMPRKDLSASKGAMTVTDVEEMESEEPAEDDDDGEPKAPKHQETEDEDEDFFDSVEDPLPVEAEARSGNQTASLRGAAKRAKKQRRKERLELIREEPLLKHPSWVAQKSPRVSGTFSTVKGKKGKRTTFASDSE